MASGSFPQVRKRHRFEDISNSREESLLSAAVAPKTRVATDFWVKTFNSFLVEKTTFGRETCPAEELNDSLKAFSFGLRKKTGSLFQGWQLRFCTFLLSYLLLLQENLGSSASSPSSVNFLCTDYVLLSASQ